jgi:hypothetical protein
VRAVQTLLAPFLSLAFTLLAAHAFFLPEHLNPIPHQGYGADAEHARE